MERHGFKAGLIKALRLIGGGACVLLGLYFSVVAVLCTQVDGVHVLGYTLMPALALLCFFASWLLLKKTRRPPRQ
ncbi:MAG: hypothetical protein ABFC62_00460 [Clostridiaceae bacterium]|nr:hypothetical protein [Eubacteriales bacterium]